MNSTKLPYQYALVSYVRLAQNERLNVGLVMTRPGEEPIIRMEVHPERCTSIWPDFPKYPRWNNLCEHFEGWLHDKLSETGSLEGVASAGVLQLSPLRGGIHEDPAKRFRELYRKYVSVEGWIPTLNEIQMENEIERLDESWRRLDEENAQIVKFL